VAAPLPTEIGAAPVDPAPTQRPQHEQRRKRFAHDGRRRGPRTERQAPASQEPRLGRKPRRGMQDETAEKYVPAEACGRSQADAISAPARARGDKPEPRSQAKTRRAVGVTFRAMKAGTCRSRFARSSTYKPVSI